MTRHKFRILSKPWTVRALTKKEYKDKHGKDSVAITHVHKRRIDLSPKGVDEETIIHELVHGYFAEMCMYSTALDDNNLEEVFAEMMSKRGREILELAARLLTLVSK